MQQCGWLTFNAPRSVPRKNVVWTNPLSKRLVIHAHRLFPWGLERYKQTFSLLLNDTVSTVELIQSWSGEKQLWTAKWRGFGRKRPWFFQDIPVLFVAMSWENHEDPHYILFPGKTLYTISFGFKCGYANFSYKWYYAWLYLTVQSWSLHTGDI
jgi:hypothetical protein